MSKGFTTTINFKFENMANDYAASLSKAGMTNVDNICALSSGKYCIKGKNIIICF